jgi:hypothetical protein
VALNDPRLDEKKLNLEIESNSGQSTCIKLGKEERTGNAMLQRQECDTFSKWLCQKPKNKGNLHFVYAYFFSSAKTCLN